MHDERAIQALAQARLTFRVFPGGEGTATASEVADGQPAEGTAPREAFQEALKHLDMAALMGGPALRASLDAAIARVQRGMQAEAAGSRSDAANKRAADHAWRSPPFAEEPLLEPPAKRQRTEGVGHASQPLDAVRSQSSPHEPSVKGQSVPLPRWHLDRSAAGEAPAADADTDAAPGLSEDAWPGDSPFTAAPPPGSLLDEPAPSVELPSLERSAPWLVRSSS